MFRWLVIDVTNLQMKILHIFYSTIPSASGGDIRSRDIIEGQARIGLDVLALSSPFQPPAEQYAKMEQIGGITYHRCFEHLSPLIISEHDQGLAVKLKKALKLCSFTKSVTDLATLEAPDVIHAHSMFFCLFAALPAARKLGVPVVYEVRSLWEERSAMVSPSLWHKLVRGVLRCMETWAMRMSDHVVVISEGLRREVIARGIAERQITLIGNAVSMHRVSGQRMTLVENHSSDWVFGYVGSLSEIEGLDLLIEAVKELRQKGWMNAFRFYGDGPALADLKLKAEGVSGLTFHGAFKPEDAPEVYASLDVIVNPRRPSALANKVTPLKPLEAMAWRKPVIVSSVAGMRELVCDGRTGVVFEAGSSKDLAKCLKMAVDKPAELIALIEPAYLFVSRQRCWSTNSKKYQKMYSNLVKKSILEE